MKNAALESLRRKRALRRVQDDGDEEMPENDDEGTRATKRQRTKLGDVTNLPEEPGMDSGRFMTIAPSPLRTSTPSRSFSPPVDLDRSSPNESLSLPSFHDPSEVRGRTASPAAPEVPLKERFHSDEAAGVKWLVDPLKEFSEAEGGEDLLRVMERLWTLECQYVAAGIKPKKRSTLNRGKNADGSERLKILGDWVAGGRTRGRRLVLEKVMLPKFVKEWNGWWSSLQPDWRKKHRGSYTRDVIGGDFDMLAIAGANGMLSVVATLSWWRSAASGKAMEQWLMAVEDVEWVMDRLIIAARGTNC